MAEKEKVKEEKPTKRYEVTEIPTQMGIAIKDNETNLAYDVNGILEIIANDVNELKKLLG